MRKTRFTATQRRCYVCGEPPGAQRRSIHAPMSLPDGQYSPSAIHGVDELPCSRNAWLEPERTGGRERVAPETCPAGRRRGGSHDSATGRSERGVSVFEPYRPTQLDHDVVHATFTEELRRLSAVEHRHELDENVERVDDGHMEHSRRSEEAVCGGGHRTLLVGRVGVQPDAGVTVLIGQLHRVVERSSVEVMNRGDKT